MSEVSVEPTCYEVTAYPFHDINRSLFVITVERRAENSWAVLLRGSQCWNRRTKAWDYEPSPSSRTDAFKRTHRFRLDQALEIARKVAPTLSVMGLTVDQAASDARDRAAS